MLLKLLEDKELRMKIHFKNVQGEGIFRVFMINLYVLVKRSKDADTEFQAAKRGLG